MQCEILLKCVRMPICFQFRVHGESCKRHATGLHYKYARCLYGLHSDSVRSLFTHKSTLIKTHNTRRTTKKKRFRVFRMFATMQTSHNKHKSQERKFWNAPRNKQPRLKWSSPHGRPILVRAEQTSARFTNI